MRMLFTLTGYVLAGYCLLCLLLYLLQRQLIYFPGNFDLARLFSEPVYLC